MGILYIVPTPIGNLEDITLHALRVLSSTQYIACEDTRKTGQLLKLLRDRFFINRSQTVHGLSLDSSLGLAEGRNTLQLISYYEQNEKERVPGLLNILKNGFDVALVSDAGTPLISDPGFRLVKACREQDIKIIALPGASSVMTALTSSGLPSDKFTFLGYPPHKSGHRKMFYTNIKNSAEIISSTFILFEAPHKLLKTFKEIHESLGDIEIVVCRELTKMHEEIWRGVISEALHHFTNPKGEIVILFHL